MRYLKYEMASKNAFDTLKGNHLVDEDDNLLKGISLTEIGDREDVPAVMDGETIVTPAVMKGTHAVDILWDGIEPIEEFTIFEVYPNPDEKPVIRTFAGLENLYREEFYTKFPELRPVED